MLLRVPFPPFTPSFYKYLQKVFGIDIQTYILRSYNFVIISMGGSESRNQTSSTSTRAYYNASEIRYRGSGRSTITPAWNKSGLG
jgi:hypothetical protein